MTVSSGVTSTGLALINESLAIFSGGVASSTTVFDWQNITIYNHGLAIDTTLNRSSWMYVLSGGTANKTVVNSGAIVNVSQDGTMDNVTVSSGGIIGINLEGTSVTDITLLPGAMLNCCVTSRYYVQGVRDGSPFEIKDAFLSDFMLDAGGTIYVLNDGKVENITNEGILSIYGAANRTTVNSGGSVFVNGGGIANSTTVNSDGDGYSMLAVQKDGTVTIYQDGAAWGIGLTLDPGWTVAGVGDFNGDGLDDFLRVNDEGYVVGEMSNGDGAFAPQVLNFLNAGWEILGVGDFNDDGSDDVLIANPTAASETVGLLGYWKGGTEWTLINGYSAEWECVATGDFDGDGKCDMLWRNSFEGDGGLTYNAYCTWIVDDPVDWRMVSVANPGEWDFLCSGDFDGNGSHDIAMINDAGVVGIWGVNDGYLSSWSILSAVNPSEWTLAGAGDFNADGTDDIAWCNIESGQVGAWIVQDKELSDWKVLAHLA